MRIEYVCHACLFIEAGGAKIATDPWFTGPAYCAQWHLFPQPVNIGVLRDTNVIALTHGHEDHFHVPSLRALPKTATVFYPYAWYGGAAEYLRELGFQHVVEAQPDKTYPLAGDASLTYIVNNLDSIAVIESRGQIFVDVNDALHSYPPRIQDIFIEAIKKRWLRIDTVFCGFGGASYFPNTIHCPGKNDREIGEVREQLFAHNFCRIVHGLAPAVGVPFAADFALLRPEQRWINNVRFPRARMVDYFRALYPDTAASTSILPMYSGDVLEDNTLIPASPYRAAAETLGLGHLVDEQYAKEIAALVPTESISENDAQSLEGEIAANIRRRSHLYTEAELQPIRFAIHVEDCGADRFFQVSIENGEPMVRRGAAPADDSLLVLKTSSRILRYSFASDWGGDAVTIGYGCEINVIDPRTIEMGRDIVCVRLLTRQPPASRHWKQEPLRMARFLLSSPATRAWVSRAVMNRGGDYNDKKNNDVMREWIFRSKCEVCRACDLPLLDDKFAASL